MSAARLSVPSTRPSASWVLSLFHGSIPICSFFLSFFRSFSVSVHLCSRDTNSGGSCTRVAAAADRSHLRWFESDRTESGRSNVASRFPASNYKPSRPWHPTAAVAVGLATLECGGPYTRVPSVARRCSKRSGQIRHLRPNERRHCVIVGGQIGSSLSMSVAVSERHWLMTPPDKRGSEWNRAKIGNNWSANSSDKMIEWCLLCFLLRNDLHVCCVG